MIRNCIVEDSGYSGIRILSSGAPVIERNKIRNNISGGIYVGSGTASASIKNNWVYNNGTGISTFITSNMTTIENNTIVGNTSDSISSFLSSSTISNCIIWNNGDDLSGCNATYSCIEDGDPCTGNISSDPCFVNIYDFFDITNANGDVVRMGK